MLSHLKNDKEECVINKSYFISNSEVINEAYTLNNIVICIFLVIQEDTQLDKRN